MKKMVAYCGIVCTDCLAFIATKNNDNAKRKETAEKWTKEFKREFKPEDINCDGCMSSNGKKLAIAPSVKLENAGGRKRLSIAPIAANMFAKNWTSFSR